MLLNYKFSNFCSFKDEAEFDMVLGKSKAKSRFTNNFIDSRAGKNILKTAVIVGENAGGKSNFINSIKYFKSLFNKNDKIRTNPRFINDGNIVNKDVNKDDTLQHFEIEILSDEGVIYLYKLQLDWMSLVKEELYCKKKKDSVPYLVFCFEREEYKNSKENSLNASIKIRNSYKDIEQILEKSVKKGVIMGLFVTKLAILGVSEATQVVTWMNEKLCPETSSINYDLYKSFSEEDDDLSIMNDSKFLDIFRMVDYSIINIDVDKDKPYSKTIIYRKTNDETIFTKEIGLDSSGVREFFAWAVEIYKVVYENKIVFADEMDRVLNPILSERIIAFINGMEHLGQFIFSTHNILHLDLKKYMKEQIYFVAKDKESLTSELYALSDFPEIRYETSNVYEFYLKGVLGGTGGE